MSIIRADSIKNRAGNGAPDFPNGLTVTGIITSTVLDNNITGNLTVSGNIGVGGTLTYEDVTNVDSLGVGTFRDGLRVSGIATATEYEVVNAGNTPIFRFRGSSNNEIGKIDADAISGTTSQLRLYTENGGNLGERLRIGPAGQIGIGGANYGTAGQALVSQGSSAAPQWATAGKVIQIKHNEKKDAVNLGSIAQGAETNIPFVASITPTSASSKLLVQMMITMDMSTTHGTFATAKKTTGGVTTEPAVGDVASSRHRITTGTNDNGSSTLRNIYIMFVDTAGTTNQIDYGFTLSHNDNSTVYIYLNYSNSDADASYTGRGMSSITVTEFSD